MVGLVLLIACFNVACLLIARGAARRKELAMRLAIGASRWRIARQLLMESAALSAAGTAVGLPISVGMVRGLLHYLPTNGMLITLGEVPDWRILVFTAALAFATVLLFGLAPAREAFKVDLLDALKGAGPAGGNRGSVSLRRGLVTAQVAFSFLLVVGALLFAKTLSNLKRTNSGLRGIDNLVTFQIDPARSGYSLPRLKAFYQQALENVRTVPGVRSAGYAWIQVLSNRMAGWDISVEGQSSDSGNREAFVNSVSPGFWRTMGIPLLAGRDFESGDIDGRPKVAIVNREFANDVFGKENPIGRHIGLDAGPGSRPDIEIVGVVEDALDRGPRDGIHRQVFFPYPQLNQPVAVAFYVRTAGDARGAFAALRRRIGELDATMPVYEMKTVEDQLNETLSTERLTATLSAASGVLATLLAALGLYGVMALTVARRTREIGLRMAVGARQSAVLWMVMKEALVLLGIGLALGIPGAYWLSRWVESQLYGVTPADVGTGGSAALILVVVAVVAGLLPACRASTIDPVQALRHE
jgi:predicted permease